MGQLRLGATVSQGSGADAEALQRIRRSARGALGADDAVLAVAFVVVGFASDDAGPSLLPTLEAFDLALTAIFIAEFGSRFLASYDRRRYLRGHWIDLVALIPAGRGLRLFRLLRLLRLLRAFAGFYRVLTHYERLAGQRRLIGLFVAWLAVAVISATALYLAEAGVNPNIETPLDALW